MTNTSDNSIINALMRLERAGSESSKTTQKLVEATIEAAQGVIDRIPEDMLHQLTSDGIHRYQLADGYSLDHGWNRGPHGVLVLDMDGVQYSLNYGDDTSLYCAPVRRAALRFAEDIAAGLLDKIAETLEVVADNNCKAIDKIVDATEGE